MGFCKQLCLPGNSCGGQDISQVSAPFTISGHAKAAEAPCTPAVGQVAVQPPLLPSSLLLPEAVQLQPNGQCQMQQGDESQQSVACTSPQVLSRQAASPELQRQVTTTPKPVRIPQDLVSCLLEVLCSASPHLGTGSVQRTRTNQGGGFKYQ